MIALAACTLAAVANGQQLINVDVGQGGVDYSNQGVLGDASDIFWNGLAWSETTATSGDLLYAAGMGSSGVTISLSSGGGFTSGNSNSLLADYHVVSLFGNPTRGTIEVQGLTENVEHVICVYSAGSGIDEAGIITLNGVKACTSGSTSNQFVEGANYVIMEVKSDRNGDITGTWEAFNEFAVINGIQIVEGLRPPEVLSIAGAQSPTVHSPLDVIPLTVNFSEEVFLSQRGGAKIELDIDGTTVFATHDGDLQGNSLTFEAIAPSLTTMNAKIVANGLQLDAGVMLIDSDMNIVDLEHGEIALPYDQISVDRLSVYPMLTDPLAPESPHYSFRVREVGGTWQPSFAWFTSCIDAGTGIPEDNYYKDQIGRWSHTYCNFEMANNVPVEIEITRMDSMGGQVDIQKATPHPRRKVKSWRIENGKAYVTLDRPALFAVDIDGQMDDNLTPSSEFLNENALHGVSIFANPFILDKPVIGGAGVKTVEPGDPVPVDDGSWTTLYFNSGVHNLFPGATWQPGDGFPLQSNRTYYIPGDAIVHGNFVNDDDSARARNIRIFGHGTLSGELIDHPDMFGVPTFEGTKPFRPIRVGGDVRACKVEGVTIADPAHHSCALDGGFNGNPDDWNYVRWTKVISWRANGDGISPNGSGYTEDCFLRTQDDGTYILGLGIRRMVYWADVNGMPLRCNQLTKFNVAPLKEPLYVEDCDVIYSRTAFGSGPRRSIFGYPSPEASFPGNTGSHVVFRNINVEDPFPTRQLFGWDLRPFKEEPGGDGEVSGVRFENIRVTSRNVDEDLDAFLGTAEAPIQGLILDNVTVGGEHYDHISDFETNGFVSGFDFKNFAPETMTYRNTSGYGKWYVYDDWDTGVEPANNDTVEHTEVPATLIVDAPAYAGTVNISHANTATLSVQQGGELTVSTGISIGASGVGALDVIDGRLRIDGSSTAALSVTSGRIHIEKGEILWAGNHVSDIKALHGANAITFANGRPTQATSTQLSLVGSPVANNQPVQIGRVGASLLYASYDSTSGYTKVWAAELQRTRTRSY